MPHDSVAASPPESQVESLVDAALAQLTHLPQHTYELEHRVGKRALDAALIGAAADRRRLDVLWLSRQTQVISSGTFSLGFHQNMASSLTALDRQVTNDKLLTKRVLVEHGLPVARGEVVDSPDEALEAMHRIGPPVVVKPVYGSGGKGVTVDIRGDDELCTAADEAFTQARRVLVEEMVAGVDLRVMTVAGQAVAAMLRVPANVIGDGTSTIRELADQKNQLRAGNAYLRHCPILITLYTEHHLAQRGMTPDSVPEPGRRVFLHYKANLSSGGDSIELVDVVHPGILRLAERAAACIPSAYHAGVDVLLERFDMPPEDQRGVLCELNLNNEMPIHVFPLYGTPVDTADATIEGYFVRAREQLEAGPHRLDLTGAPSPSSSSSSGAPDHSIGAPDESSGTPGLTAELPDSLTGVAEVLAALPWAEVASDASVRARTPRRIDQHQLTRALQDAGLHDVRVQGRLIHGVRADRDIVLERSGMTMFAAALGEQVSAMYELALAAGLPTVRWARFARRDLAAARALVESEPGPWRVQPALRTDSIRRRFRVADPARLDEVWEQLQPGAREVLLERVPRGLACTVLMVGGRVCASVLQTPFGVTGDGTRRLGELIEEKLAARADHPYLRHRPVKQSLLSDEGLARKRLSRDDVPAAGRAVWLARSPLPELGPDTFGFSGCPYPAPVELAHHAIGLLGQRSVTSVTCVRDERAGSSEWVVYRVDPDPILAFFAFPWAGETGPVYPTVAGELLAGPHYALPR